MTGGRGGQRRRVAFAGRAGVAWLSGLLLAGCAGAPRKAGDDPLLGKLPAVPVAPAAGAVAKGEQGPLAALPAPSSSTSPAALANAAVPKLDGDRELRIGPPPSAKLGGPSGDEGGKGRPTAEAPGKATISKPEPLRAAADLAKAPTLQPVTMAGGTTVLVQSVDHGLTILEGRGMKAFRLELQRDTGQWRCTCSLPDRQNPSLKKTYDTQARDRLAALRALIEQVEKENP